MYRSILVPLDGSSFSEHALPLARALAHACRARLRLAHVHVTPVAYYADGLPVINAENDLLSREAERDYLERLRAELSADGLATTCVLLEEPVGAALSREAAEREADLVIMTTHGRGGWSRMWLGSVADELMHSLNIPLLLIHPREGTPGPTGEFRRILIVLDGSPLAEQILHHALILLRVDEEPAGVTGAPPRPMAIGGQLVSRFETARDAEWNAHPIYASQTLTSERAAIAAQMLVDASYLREAGYKVMTEVCFGDPAREIVGLAESAEVDLIAMATHGRSAIGRLALGSVAEEVVRRAPVPVMLIRPSLAAPGR